MNATEQKNVLTAEETALLATKGDEVYMHRHTGSMMPLKEWIDVYTSMTPDEWGGMAIVVLSGPQMGKHRPVSLLNDCNGEPVLIEMNQVITYTFEGEKPDSVAKNIMPHAAWQYLMKKLAQVFWMWPEEAQKKANEGLTTPFDDWLCHTYSICSADCKRYAVLVGILITGWEKRDLGYYYAMCRLASVMWRAFRAGEPLMFKIKDAT